MIQTETVQGLPLYDCLAETFSKPYTFVSYENICRETGVGKKQIYHTLSRLRRADKDIEAVLHVGGWCLVPKGSGTQFNLENFRDSPAQISHLSDGQQKAFEQIWFHVREVERIEFEWRGQTIRVLKPLIPPWVYETLCTMISVLTEQDRGLIWQDMYPVYVGDKRGRSALGSTASIVNDFCESKSIPFRLTSPCGRSQYRFVGSQE
jgi:hypothetical protein